MIGGILLITVFGGDGTIGVEMEGVIRCRAVG